MDYTNNFRLAYIPMLFHEWEHAGFLWLMALRPNFVEDCSIATYETDNKAKLYKDTFKLVFFISSPKDQDYIQFCSTMMNQFYSALLCNGVAWHDNAHIFSRYGHLLRYLESLSVGFNKREKEGLYTTNRLRVLDLSITGELFASQSEYSPVSCYDMSRFLSRFLQDFPGLLFPLSEEGGEYV